jgi:hypothetical protein
MPKMKKVMAYISFSGNKKNPYGLSPGSRQDSSTLAMAESKIYIFSATTKKM